MAGITLEKGSTIYTVGQPMTALHLITDGYVTVSYPGGSYRLGKGDVIGICEICSEIHFLSYTVAADASILTYKITTPAVLDELLKRHTDVARLFLLSAFQQMNILLERCSVSDLNCSSLYQALQEDQQKYELICKRYRMTPRTFEDVENPGTYLTDETPDLWLTGYYQGLAHIMAGENFKLLVQDSSLSCGFLKKCSLDFRKAYSALEDQFRYIQQINDFYFNDSGNDLFDFYTSLYYKLGASCADSDDLFSDINRMIMQLDSGFGAESDLFKLRVDSFRQKLSLLQTSTSKATDSKDSAETMSELVNSLNTILEFADANPELAGNFRQHVHLYKLLEDKFSPDEESVQLRADLTDEFYLIYTMAFRHSLEVLSVPAPVMMFLYFGYVDEELAGISNALYLYNLTKNMEDHSRYGVYTFYDWLLAIFHGNKEPSRNEFEQDYTDYIHKQKISGNITDIEQTALENDAMAKVNFELRNLFPLANKITYGRVTVFCPLFTEAGIFKDLRSSYVTVSAISKIVEDIKKIDYSLFYRESMDTEHLDVLGKEIFHFEFLPDIILFPNVGMRSIMWQEIEGKKRNSSSRILFSIFHLEDLNLSMIRLAGEFRWDLCKRIQGAHWNDVSDRSLTSEYCDYIQFYRKNHELSSDAKEKVRSGLQRSKNSFKEMFVKDYIIWIMFEGNGSPRLNKVARKILFSYCPFPKEICEKLKLNPLYTELLNQRELRVAQRLHHLDGVKRKLRNGGISVPNIIDKEIDFLEGTINS